MATAVARPRPGPKAPLRTGRKKRVRIGFVCFGNSCRSQMAEAWARYLSAGQVEAVSAGVHPLGFITPETEIVMDEKQVGLKGHASKGFEEVDWEMVDVMVNMSHLPTASIIPSFSGRRIEWKVRDPFGYPLATYRRVRDDLEKRVKKLLIELKSSSSGSAAPPVA
jgi:arsenate reductase